tara:strand:- start:123 stop:434 length:312 start_codon:yes stop_codon:yes gene_type:complete
MTNKNYLAHTRTFEASIRTNAIFAGIALLLVKNKQKIPAITVISSALLINSFLVFNFHETLNDMNPEFESEHQKYLHFYAPFGYSLILTFILIMLLSYAINSQ